MAVLNRVVGLIFVRATVFVRTGALSPDRRFEIDLVPLVLACRVELLIELTPLVDRTTFFGTCSSKSSWPSWCTACGEFPVLPADLACHDIGRSGRHRLGARRNRHELSPRSGRPQPPVIERQRGLVIIKPDQTTATVFRTKPENQASVVVRCPALAAALSSLLWPGHNSRFRP